MKNIIHNKKFCYLVYYVKDGFFGDSKPIMAIEHLELAENITIDEMKAEFSQMLDKKYGEKKWKIEYFLS